MDQTPGTLLDNSERLPRGPFTVAEFHALNDAGILNEDSRVELVEGELVWMHAIGSPHAGTVKRLNRLLTRAVADRALVSVQDPIQLGDSSEPQPDLALLAPRADDYTAANPRADEVLLVIEVASSSLDFDRGVKRALYARHAIPELWIVNLDAMEVEVCREPGPDGYGFIEVVGPAAELTIGGLPDLKVLVRDFLQ